MKSMIIGMGEVGCCLFEALHEGGMPIQVAIDKRLSERAKGLTAKYGTQTAQDVRDHLQDVEVILSCVEGETAPVIAEIISEHGRPGQILIDFSTASADAKRQASALLAKREITYIDVAIMGAIALTGASTSMIAAGVSADSKGQSTIEAMQGAGIPVKVISNSQAGDAISLKLLRSVFTKGLEALTTECLSAAEHLGVRESLYEVLSDIDKAHLPRFLEMLVTTHLVHAERRRKEVERANEQLVELGLTSLMLPAVTAVFERTERLHDRSSTPTPPSPEVALAILTEISRSPQNRPADSKVTT
ncbi:NAD(P)-dependent oxidoreductase [Orrella marina]|uniref:6-phosphogluconate dehydrogenase n=1 Tax=Orrella marina TaxID=2163011 RepID=A0A2R4XG80_9BURK|nr:NAD(P)-binding domain-containing protein [Orrella marina]AWB32836.1 6-phosphogluconate dehydrogenase [Orrella marina]